MKNELFDTINSKDDLITFLATLSPDADIVPAMDTCCDTGLLIVDL